MDTSVSGDKCDQERSRCKDLNNRNTEHVERKNKSDTSNSVGNWNSLKIINN
jgi:hypothetical protein